MMKKPLTSTNNSSPKHGMMDWATLISDKRLGLEHHSGSHAGRRSDFERDFDRLVFSSPFRRLQNKTQVFPLPGSVFVHNRLTHSMEVASVGRSMANEIASALSERYPKESPQRKALESIGEIVAAACLAHDLGNPPFGHSGETAISTFFSEGPGADIKDELPPEQWADLIHYEGNANAFRVLTHQFHGRRQGGFAMTYSMLASIVKYPFTSTLAGNRNKFGFFQAEKEVFERIADDLGMLKLLETPDAIRYARHPLVYIVEAADDICYEVMDLEDAHKLKIISTNEVKQLLLNFFTEERRQRAIEIMANVTDPNEQIAYLRSGVIGTLVGCCARAFVENEREILSGEFNGQLLKSVPECERKAYESCNVVSWDKIYRAPDVVNIELAGNRIISFLLEKLIHAVRNPHLNYSRLLLSQVPEQYNVHAPDLYGKVLAVLDHVSAMTDVYALDLYRKLNGLSLPVI